MEREVEGRAVPATNLVESPSKNEPKEVNM